MCGNKMIHNTKALASETDDQNSIASTQSTEGLTPVNCPMMSTCIAW